MGSKLHLLNAGSRVVRAVIGFVTVCGFRVLGGFRVFKGLLF